MSRQKLLGLKQHLGKYDEQKAENRKKKLFSRCQQLAELSLFIDCI